MADIKVDVVLVLVTVVTVLLLFVAGVYLVVFYQHPDDKNDAYFPKVVVLCGFVLAGATVLLLPLDVANNAGYAGCDGYDVAVCGGLNMDLLWKIIIWLVPLWVFGLIPFATFYYEADDGMLMAGTSVAPDAKPKSRLMSAICYQLMLTFIVAIIFITTYLLFPETKIPVKMYTGDRLTTLDTYDFNSQGSENFSPDGLRDIDVRDENYILTSKMTPVEYQTISLRVEISYFYAGLLAWAGWFLFAIFAGIGMAALPLDLVLAYFKRPRHMDASEFTESQTSLRERVNELVDIGELIKVEREEKKQLGLTGGWGSSIFDSEKRKEARDERQATIGFKQAVFLLEQDVEDFQACHANWENYNPLIPYFAGLAGLLSFLITILWVTQICVYLLPLNPATTFLNSYFEWFDLWFPLFGVLSVALFTVYLLLCAYKGCFKFGMRFLCLQLHPMKPGKTYMSSFLFNTGLILLCCFPCVQFCTSAFSDYARYATIRQIFGYQIMNLNFFGWFWKNHIFVYALLIVLALTSVYLVCQPTDKATNSQALRDRLRSRRG